MHPLGIDWRKRRTAKDVAGYVLVRMPEHPQANCNGFARRARLVIEEREGRLLQPSEVVHHVNGKKDDDRPSNLRACQSQAQHAAEHWRPSARRLRPDRSWRHRRAVDIRQMRRAPVHPGTVFAIEFRRALDLTRADVGRRLGWSPQWLNAFEAGGSPITAERAIQLAAMTGTSPEFWLNLQMQHDLWHALQKAKRVKRVIAGEPFPTAAKASRG